MVPIDRLTGSFTGMPVAYGGNAPLTTAGNPAPRCIFLTNLKTMLRSEAHHLIIPAPPSTDHCKGDDHTRRRQWDYLRCTAVSAELVISNQYQSLNLVLNTRANYWFGSTHSVSLTAILFRNSTYIQLTAEASFISLICVLIILILIAVCLDHFSRGFLV